MAEPAKFIVPLYLVKKTFPLLKKVLKLGIQKVAIFLFLSKMRYTKNFIENLTLDFVIVDWPVQEKNL